MDISVLMCSGYMEQRGSQCLCTASGTGGSGNGRVQNAPWRRIQQRYRHWRSTNYFRTGITGIRDVSEQTFQSFFTGNRTIPNKYKRAFGFPFLFGLQHRIFPRAITDNFRLFVGAGLGPAMAFTYPYLDDADENGFRTIRIDPQTGRIRGAERLNDFFTGWRDGSTHWGFSGELTIGADLGSSFDHRAKIEFGYFFYYFSEGLQIM